MQLTRSPGLGYKRRVGIPVVGLGGSTGERSLRSMTALFCVSFKNIFSFSFRVTGTFFVRIIIFIVRPNNIATQCTTAHKPPSFINIVSHYCSAVSQFTKFTIRHTFTWTSSLLQNTPLCAVFRVVFVSDFFSFSIVLYFLLLVSINESVFFVYDNFCFRVRHRQNHTGTLQTPLLGLAYRTPRSEVLTLLSAVS